MSPVRKIWILDQEIHWIPNIRIPAIPASCFLVPEQTVVCGSYFIWCYILNPCFPVFFMIFTPQFQELFCANLSGTYLYPCTSALLFLSNSVIIFCFYPTPDPLLEIFPLVAWHGIVGVGYFLLNFTDIFPMMHSPQQYRTWTHCSTYYVSHRHCVTLQHC
jgi:hypothetical protein